MDRIGKRAVLVLNKTIAATEAVDVTSYFRDFLSLPTIWIEATENSGTATLDVDIFGSQDGTNYLELLSFTQLAANGREVKALPFHSKKVRVDLTVTGTGNWTIKVYAIGPMPNAQGAYMP